MSIEQNLKRLSKNIKALNSNSANFTEMLQLYQESQDLGKRIEEQLSEHKQMLEEFEPQPKKNKNPNLDKKLARLAEIKEELEDPQCELQDAIDSYIESREILMVVRRELQKGGDVEYI